MGGTRTLPAPKRQALQAASSVHLLGLGLVLAVLLYGLLAAQVTNRITREMAVVSARDLGDMLATWSRGPIERREWASLNSLARLHSSNAGLRFVTFVVNDDALPSTDRPVQSRSIQTASSWGAGANLSSGLPSWAVIEVPVRDWIAPGPQAPDRASAEAIGTVVLGIEPDRAGMLISRGQYFIATGTALFGSLLMGLGALFWRRLRNPLEVLAEQANQLVRKHSDDMTDRRDQSPITQVGSALGELANELANRETELNELHSRFEQRIQERTQDLHDLATRDPLTGLHNRRYFSQTLEEHFVGATRYGNTLSLAVIDIDDFKLVNDRLGHAAGDEVLITLAAALATEIRSSDVAARFGGDEFIVLMPQTRTTDARPVLERFHRAFVDGVRIKLDGQTVTLSIGVVSTGPTIGSSSELFAAADQAMYQAKRQGKNRICEDAHNGNIIGSTFPPAL